MLEANGKVYGIGEILHPSQTLAPIWLPLQIYAPQGVDLQNLIKIDSAVAALRVREKRGFAWVFGRPLVKRFALCYRTVVLSVCLSVCL